jgi:methylase of polypeptide subunit release factors
MTGSGTCADVCRELRIPCTSLDIRHGFDATDPASYKERLQDQKFDLIWAHPPYWRQKLYTNNPRDLSRAETLDGFLKQYGAFIQNCSQHLSSKGKLAILMGDYPDRKAGFVSLTYHTKQLAIAAGLRQHCTDIVRFSHGASSSRKTYQSSFIPTLHDTCMVFEKA